MNLQQNRINQKYDVIVVGAGIVGLSAALALSQQNFKVALVEAQLHPDKNRPLAEYGTKVVAVTRASENLFKHINIWQNIVESRYCAYQHMTVWDNVLDGRISFSAVDFFEDNLGYIIEQQVILAALWQALAEQNTVSQFLGKTIKQWHKLEENNAVVLNDEEVLTAPLLIGADGAKSKVRELCGIQSEFLDYQQTAIVATVKGTRTHANTAYQRFDQDGPLALLPLQDKHVSSIVWTTTPHNASRLISLSEQDFGRELNLQTNGVMGELSLCSARFSFELTTQHAKSYALRGCVLVGDAAHTIHPLAGLGVNLGLLDVASLVEVLSSVTNNSALGKLSVLKRYERQRKLHNQIMIWAMSLFKNGFGSEKVLIQNLRNMGLNWVNNQISLKQFFAKMALGTAGPIPRLAKKKCSKDERC